MNTKKKIFFTESAKERLEKFHFDIDKEIENYFQEKKNVPGDDFIEITALDIGEFSQRFKLIRPYKTNIRKVIPVVYTIMGILLTLVGLFYEEILLIIKNQPERLILIVSGILMIFISWLYLSLIRLKEKREEFEKNIIDDEINKNRASFVDKKINLESSFINKSTPDEKIENEKKIVEETEEEEEDVKNEIVIHSAKYFYEKNWINVTSQIRELVQNNIFEFTINNDLMGGDPYYGKIKTLEIDYTINDIRKKIVEKEKKTIRLK
jgi:hypothetical protein